jgi:thiosulfate reductase cytochrome b subunit
VDTDLGFPLWLRLAHWFNVLFLTLLVRSGLEILSAFPKLYRNDHCVPGTEWLRLTRKKMPKNQLWTSYDEEVKWPSWLALPGGSKLGLGRAFHFATTMGWTLTGLCYVVLLFTSAEWHRLVPTSLEVFPSALRAANDYLHLRVAKAPAGLPFNALQQLTYFAVVFLLTPFQILTGVAQSPAIEARFPRFLGILGGRQRARSLHFLGLCGFVAFLFTHVVLVFVHGFAREMDRMVLGRSSGDGSWTAVGIGVGIITAIVLIHVIATRLSWAAPQRTQNVLDALVDLVRSRVLHPLVPRGQYPDSMISSFMRINGRPPTAEHAITRDDRYIHLLEDDFADWRMEISGLVKHPLSLSLDDLKAMPKREQTTLHNCVQGWTAIAKWGGVALSEILDRCEPLAGARYVVVRSYQRHEEGGGKAEFYECIDLELARHAQTMLAYEMNGASLPINHGRPLRLRVETVVGYKMVKWIRSIELVADYHGIGAGRGGSREDVQLMGRGAEV